MPLVSVLFLFYIVIMALRYFYLSAYFSFRPCGIFDRTKDSYLYLYQVSKSSLENQEYARRDPLR
jgi:hypothetical protein